MGSALDDLLDLLELEVLEVNLFRGLAPTRTPNASSAARSPRRRSSPPAAPSTA